MGLTRGVRTVVEQFRALSSPQKRQAYRQIQAVWWANEEQEREKMARRVANRKAARAVLESLPGPTRSP